MKVQLRRQMLEKRQNMQPEDVKQKSLAIFHRLIAAEIFKTSENIMAYMSFRNEVHTKLLINYCLTVGKTVILPVTVKKTNQLILSEVRDLDRELHTGTYGIKEPTPAYIRPFPAEKLDLILVPAVAFDPAGYRLGYGGGYYDRFLAKLYRKIPSAGLAFEMQIVENIPVEPNDLPVDYLITEERTLNCIYTRKNG